MITHATSSVTLTFDELAAREPALARLEHQCRTMTIPPELDEIDLWFESGVKGTMAHLVGWDRRQHDPVLSTSRAYDIAYLHLLSILERRVDERRGR